MIFHALLLLSVLPAIVATQHRVRVADTDKISATKLLILYDAFLEDCHSCLVKRAGIERIILVSTSLNTYSYLFLGRNSVSESILAECNTDKSCCFAPTALSKHRHVHAYSVFRLGSI